LINTFDRFWESLKFSVIDKFSAPLKPVMVGSAHPTNENITASLTQLITVKRELV
jgi:hypothetical protein